MDFSSSCVLIQYVVKKRSCGLTAVWELSLQRSVYKYCADILFESFQHRKKIKSLFWLSAWKQSACKNWHFVKNKSAYTKTTKSSYVRPGNSGVRIRQLILILHRQITRSFIARANIVLEIVCCFSPLSCLSKVVFLI